MRRYLLWMASAWMVLPLMQAEAKTCHKKTTFSGKISLTLKGSARAGGFGKARKKAKKKCKALGKVHSFKWTKGSKKKLGNKKTKFSGSYKCSYRETTCKHIKGTLHRKAPTIAIDGTNKCSPNDKACIKRLVARVMKKKVKRLCEKSGKVEQIKAEAKNLVYAKGASQSGPAQHATLGRYLKSFDLDYACTMKLNPPPSK